MSAQGNTRIVDRLVAEKLLTVEQREAVLSYHRRQGGRVEEALIETACIDELELLRFLANRHRTRFVSTEKLSKAEVDRVALRQVPKKLAESHGVFPVLFDDGRSTLSIVTADPDDAGALHEVQLVSGAREVIAYVGRPAAVRAAINRAYNGDIHAFAVLDRRAHAQFTDMLDVFERNLVSEETMAAALADESGREREFSAKDIESEQAASAKPAMSQTGVGAGEGYLETLNVLISLVEKSRPDLRGHSAHVARLVRKSAERIGVPDSEIVAYTVAAYIHDLGKMGSYHLTALNTAEYDGHAAAARKVATAPTRMLEAVSLPMPARRAVECMYERYDGKGHPGSFSGKDIPLGARLLAIADTYADLTQNPRNPYRRALKPAQACDVLVKFGGRVFDPNLVDLFKHMVTGEDLKARLLANRHKALLIDPDPEESTVLELRMVEQGFEVELARTSDQAAQLLERGDFEIVVSELDLKPQSGLELLSIARQQPWGQDIPWVITCSENRRADAHRAFELGAADFVTKPVAADLLVAKMRQLLQQDRKGTRGVSGSLQEMSLPDIVQVLWHGRKSGSLRVRSAGRAGEIHFVEGQIHNALWGPLRGEEAFYGMLGLDSGEFALDPNQKVSGRTINDSPEALLLEGMRRLDENASGNGVVI